MSECVDGTVGAGAATLFADIARSSSVATDANRSRVHVGAARRREAAAELGHVARSVGGATLIVVRTVRVVGTRQQRAVARLWHVAHVGRLRYTTHGAFRCRREYTLTASRVAFRHSARRVRFAL